MPELPEVETVARELDHSLKNRKILSVEVLTPKIVGIGPGVLAPKRSVSPGTAKKFTVILAGQKILSVRRRAKLLIFDLSGPWSMLAHLKMTGQFIFEDKKLRAKTKGKYRIYNKPTAPFERLPCKHTRVIFEFMDRSKLYFNDVRKFGYLKLIRDNEIGQVKELKEFGPEPLDKKFTLLTLFAAVNKRKNAKIKQVLMDQKIVVGIGNIYSDEILFHSGVRPERIVPRIKNQEIRKIYKYIRIVLKIAIKAKGSSVGDFVRTDGSWGKMGKHHFVYGRSGLPCKRCGFVIKSVKLGGRTASFCPKCQK